jgi:8-oxo-dGTP pyrophosphatase MutT (NUDIX family)
MTLDAGDEAAGRARFGTVPPTALHCGEEAPQRAKQAVESIDELPSHKPSAVLVPVFRDREAELRLVLVIRGSQGLHGGQLALPGGAAETHDRSLLDTALREAEEEIGLRRRDVDILAALDPIDSRTSGFRVHPFLARVPPQPEWQVASGEITGVVTPAVRALSDPARRREQRMSFPTWPEDRIVACVEVTGGHLLWGLTLRILDPVLPRLLAGEWAI